MVMTMNITVYQDMTICRPVDAH